jgi:hypothetical protein
MHPKCTPMQNYAYFCIPDARRLAAELERRKAAISKAGTHAEVREMTMHGR